MSLRNLDDTIHAIHTNTEWEAELRLSDLRAVMSDPPHAAVTIRGLEAELSPLRLLCQQQHETIRELRAAMQRSDAMWRARCDEATRAQSEALREIVRLRAALRREWVEAGSESAKGALGDE
jgi:hypothetical protein